jgi:hypothetical protein
MVCVLPPHVVLLGDALASVARSATHAMTRRVRLSGQEFVTLDDLTYHMGVIQQALTHLSPRLDGLMNDVIHKVDVGAVEVGRATGRFEQVLFEFIDGYLEAKASHAGPESGVGRSLILGVYRQHIRAICAWLEQLAEVIANPGVNIQKRGIAHSPNAELTVTLNMTSPPEMEKLDALAKSLLQPNKMPNDPLPRFEQYEAAAPGVLGTIGALAFGVGITQAVLGRSHG